MCETRRHRGDVREPLDHPRAVLVIRATMEYYARGLVLVASALPMLSCGGAVGEAVRPDDYTAAGVSGGPNACEGPGKQAKPLIVDLDPDSRVDLEAAMKRGVAVVAFDCKSLRVLTSCKVGDAKYEYAGVSRKEQVIQLTSQDDLAVSLPISSAKLGGEVKSGRSIDLALVRVGQSSAPLGSITRDQLQGSCEGATHVIQTATVGAFSMSTGSVGKVGALAEMFGVGATAKSESERKTMTKDGSLEACRTSDPDASAPPAECRSQLQVTLLPLLGDVPIQKVSGPKPVFATDGKAKPVAAAENPCPTGFAFVNGVCERAADKPMVCAANDATACSVQCEKGSAESCLNLGRLKSKAESIAPFKKGCDGGALDACGALALAMAPSLDAADVASQAKAALAIAQKGCEGGSGYACSVAGSYELFSGYKIVNAANAVKSWERGCSLGNGDACGSLAAVLLLGEVVPQDAARGVALLDDACQAGDAVACSEVADVYRTAKFGGSARDHLKGFDPDSKKAVIAFKRACTLRADQCEYAASKMQEMAPEVDPKETLPIAERGCAAEDEMACALLAKMYTLGEGVAKDEAKAREYFAKACNNGKGDEESCKEVGQ